MAASTGTSPNGATGSTNGKPQAGKALDSTREAADTASAATLETNRPSAEKILDTSSPATGTLSSKSVTQSDRGKSSTPSYSSSEPAGIVTAAEPGSAIPTAAEPFVRPDSETTGTSTTDISPRTDGRLTSDPDSLIEVASEIGQKAGDRVAEEWQRQKQQVSKAAYRATRQSRRAVDAARIMITEHPLATAMVALGVGLLLGSILGSQARRSQSDRYWYSRPDPDLGEYKSSPRYRSGNLESDFRRAEANAGYDRSGY